MQAEKIEIGSDFGEPQPPRETAEIYKEVQDHVRDIMNCGDPTVVEPSILRLREIFYLSIPQDFEAHSKLGVTVFANGIYDSFHYFQLVDLDATRHSKRSRLIDRATDFFRQAEFDSRLMYGHQRRTSMIHTFTIPGCPHLMLDYMAHLLSQHKSPDQYAALRR